MKLARTNVEWVAQVTLLRPGFLPQMGLDRNTQVSKARPGPPTQSREVVACFSTERSAVERSAVPFPLFRSEKGSAESGAWYRQTDRRQNLIPSSNSRESAHLWQWQRVEQVRLSCARP